MFDNIGKDTDDEARRRRAASLLLTSAGAASLIGLIAGIAAYTAVEVLQAAPVEAVVALLETPEPELSPLPPPPPPPAGKAASPEQTPPDPETPPETPPDLDDEVKQQINDAPQPSGSANGDENGDLNGKEGGIPGGTDEGEPCGGSTGRPCGPVEMLRIIHHSEVEVRTRTLPSYPEAARALSLGEQRCIVTVSIDEEGRPYDAEVAQCPVVFHESSKAAILKWRWYPPKEGKNKIKVRTTIGITYRLD